MATPLTRPYSETRRERARSDPEFRRLLLLQAIEYLSQGDLLMGRWTLHNFIDATTGFEKLGKALGKRPKNLIRMLADDAFDRKQNKDLTAIIDYLQDVEGVEFKVSCKSGKPRRKTASNAGMELADA